MQLDSSFETSTRASTNENYSANSFLDIGRYALKIFYLARCAKTLSSLRYLKVRVRKFLCVRCCNATRRWRYSAAKPYVVIVAGKIVIVICRRFIIICIKNIRFFATSAVSNKSSFSFLIFRYAFFISLAI